MSWIIPTVTLLIGFLAGWLIARRQQQPPASRTQPQDGMLELLDDLESWDASLLGRRFTTSRSIERP